MKTWYLQIAAILGKKSHLLKPHLDTILRQHESIDIISALLDNLDKLLVLIFIKGKLSDNVVSLLKNIITSAYIMQIFCCEYVSTVNSFLAVVIFFKT